MSTNLFGHPTDWTLVFTPAEVEVLQRPLPDPAGDGGWQLALRQVCDGLTDNVATVSDDVLRAIHRYAERGTGGYQQRCRVVRSAAWRQGWSF